MCYSLMLLEIERSYEPFHADVKILGGWDYFRAFVLLCTSARDFISATAAVLPTVSGSDISGESVDNNSCQPGKTSTDGRSVVRLWSSWHEGGFDTLSQSPWFVFFRGREGNPDQCLLASLVMMWGFGREGGFHTLPQSSW